MRTVHKDTKFVPWLEHNKQPGISTLEEFPIDDKSMRPYYEHRHKETDAFQGSIHINTTIPPDEFLNLMYHEWMAEDNILKNRM